MTTNPNNKSELPSGTRTPVLAAVLIVIGVLMVAAGGAVFALNLSRTDSEGWAYSSTYHVSTPTYAFVLFTYPYKLSAWGLLGPSNVAQLKLLATPTNAKELFIGCATASAGQAYCESFEREMPSEWHWRARPYYAEISIQPTAIYGTGAPQLPQDQDFWRASSSSSTTATITYLPLKEQHLWFIINLDGSRNVSADIQIAFRSPILTVLPPGLCVAGAIVLVLGVYRRRKGSRSTTYRPPARV